MKRDEELLSKQRAIELWDQQMIDTFEVGTYKGLQQIHHYLFQDLFDFSGKTRTVNLAKGNFRFASAMYLDQALSEIEKMPETTFDEIIDKYVEMNVAHPFREGNGRATRIWLDGMLKKNLEQCIDWSRIDKSDYLSAMERSPVNTLEMKHVLREALTDEIESRQVYMRGIQQSYQYEGQDQYDIHELANPTKEQEMEL